MIGVVATLKAKEGQAEDLKSTLQSLQEAVRKNEPDCLQYDLFQDAADPSAFVMMEQYASREALEAHGKTDYFQAHGAKLMSLLAGAPELRFLGRLS